MKRTKLNAFFSLLLVLVLLMGLATTALAADSSVSIENGQITVFQPGTATSSDLFDGFKGVMPGDVLDEKITIKNNAADCDYIKVYMRALLHDEEGNPVSEEVLAQLQEDTRRGEQTELEYMYDFLSQLHMTVMNGTQQIYDASPDELDGLAENVYLGSIRRNQSIELDVELTIPRDLDNKYAARIGEVDWLFTIEGFDDPAPPDPPSYNDTLLTVRKVWVDDGTIRPESIIVELLRNRTVVGEIKLNDRNQWTYTWDDLSERYNWSVREKAVPAGYDESYSTVRTITTITNTQITPPNPPTPPGPPDPPTPPPTPVEPVNLSVVKRWDDNKESDRPDSVKVTLYDGETPVETVMLGDWNDWSYTWRSLDGDGNWQILETNIPKGYVPYYWKNGDTLVITNTASLIQTGQLSWPIPVLSALGLVVAAYGVYLISKKRKNGHAE